MEVLADQLFVGDRLKESLNKDIPSDGYYHFKVISDAQYFIEKDYYKFLAHFENYKTINIYVNKFEIDNLKYRINMIDFFEFANSYVAYLYPQLPRLYELRLRKDIFSTSKKIIHRFCQKSDSRNPILT